MSLKLIILTPLILTFGMQMVTYFSGDDSNHIYGLNKANLSDFNIAAAGDWGCTDNTKITVSNIVNKNPELVLGLGDYAYRNDADCWLKIISPIADKMKIVIGNHDDKIYDDGTYLPGPKRLQQYMAHFNLSKQYYSFNYQNVHFVAMSTEKSFEKGSMQYRFVERDLKKASSDPNINWIIVFYHRIAYTSPSMVGPVIDLRDTYHPLFDKYGVDLVVQGHSHHYQRSYPISYNAGDSSNPSITDKNITNYSDPKGQIFAIVGTGGVDVTHNFTGAPAEFTARQLYGYGFLNLDVIQNGTTLIGEFHDNDGTIRDRFSITKPSIELNGNLTASSEPSPILMNDTKGKFRIETVFKGLKSPTDMAFLDPKNASDIIVLEKNKGTVQRIVNGELQASPMMDVNVLSNGERGLLGVLVLESRSGSKNIYLYYTEANGTSDKCPKPDYCLPEIDPSGNKLYKYELPQDGTKLINPKLIMDLPAVPGPTHNGGKMTIGPDNNIYLVIGDIRHTTKAQNYEDGNEPDGTGGILRTNREGYLLDKGYLGDEYPLNLYYAYGIRNSFGLDFDPVKGNLWDTENGPDFGDEINLVKPGFNSGWKHVQGIWEHNAGKPQDISLNPDNLEDFNGRGEYSEPEFTFFNTVGVTAIKFLNSDKMGSEYKDDLFVGDIKNGNMYHFDLSIDRSSLMLDGNLADKIANSPEELDGITFAKGFSGISDLELGPDGYLYVLSYGKGIIYRIIPT